MASSVDISTYTVPIEISRSSDTFVAIQVSSTSSLDADVTVSLQHATDNQLIDIADTSTVIASGENTILIETFDFTLQTLYLKVDGGSATVGTLTINTSTKKKVDDSVTATVEGIADTNVTNEYLNVRANDNGLLVETLQNLLLEQMKTNKILNKIYK